MGHAVILWQCSVSTYEEVREREQMPNRAAAQDELGRVMAGKDLSTAGTPYTALKTGRLCWRVSM
jgi:hypothetical protein